MATSPPTVSDVVRRLKHESECRTPIVFFEDTLKRGNTPMDVVKYFGDVMEAHVECFNCENPDDTISAGRLIDKTILNGDWCLVTFSKEFHIEEFLRFLGRRMMTLMPDTEKRPNLELFRLWLALPRETQLPALFKQVAIILDTLPSTDTDGESPRHSLRRESSGTKSDVTSDDGGSQPINTRVGPLFHRRLELTQGKKPTSSATIAGELHARRVQSAVHLRQVAGRNPHPPVSGAGLPPLPTVPTPASAISAQATGERDAFEQECADAVQSIYGNMLKTYCFNPAAAMRMLACVRSLVHTPHLTLSDGVPGTSCDGLELGKVLRTDGEMVTREATWRHVPVLAEQMSVAAYERNYENLVHIRFALRHPFINTPLSLLQDSNSEYCYLVSELPSVGPVPVYLRSVELDVPHQMRYAAQVGSCVVKALLFMHGCGYVHRDLMAQNILDMGNGQFKLCLTDRCMQLSAGGTCSSDGIAPRWSSPEALSTTKYFPSDEVWSVGVLLWEVLTSCREAPMHKFTQKDDVATMLLRGHRLAIPHNCDAKFWDRIVAPCFASRDYRPPLDHLANKLSEYLDQIRVSPSSERGSPVIPLRRRGSDEKTTNTDELEFSDNRERNDLKRD